jgi:hypothetical protein
MTNLFVAALLGVVCLVSSCQQISSTADQPASTAVPAVVTTDGAPTATAAQAMVARHVQGLPQTALYQLDSMRVVEVDTHWQVQVPRTDWAGRMPNAAAFDVDKQTGRVTTVSVK